MKPLLHGNVAAQPNLETIACPAISTGDYRFPIQRATRIALGETMRFLQSMNNLASLPSGLVCHHKGSLDDPDFNNVQLEIQFPVQH